MILVDEREGLTCRIMRFTITDDSRLEKDNTAVVTLPLDSIAPNNRKSLDTVIARRPPDISNKTASKAIDQKQT